MSRTRVLRPATRARKTREVLRRKRAEARKRKKASADMTRRFGE